MDKKIPLLAISLILMACGGGEPATETVESPPTDGSVAFTGATVWDGTGAAPMPNATILTRGGRIVSVSQQPPPDGVSCRRHL